MDSNVTAAHDSNPKRGLNDSTTSEEEDSFDVKKVKLEINESDSNVLLGELQHDFVPELTPVHKTRYNIKLEVKSEGDHSGYDSSPTNSEYPSPFDMGKSFERLIEKGRAEFTKVRAQRESERAAPIKIITSAIASTSNGTSWRMKQKKDSHKENKSKTFCFHCKRYGHFKSHCRSPFQYRYPQRYLNEHPELRQKLRENSIRKRMTRENENQKQLPWQAQHHSHSAKWHFNSKFHPNGDTSFVNHNNPQTNLLQLNQISEVVNQILQNQLKMMSNQQAQITYENFNFGHNNNIGAPITYENFNFGQNNNQNDRQARPPTYRKHKPTFW